MVLTNICKISDIQKGTMKGFEVNGHNILVSNIDGQFYAISNRCSHMNALLSMGKVIPGGKVICPLHYAQFDLKTGQKLREPNFKEPTFMGRAINFIITNVVHKPEVVTSIKTYNQKTYELKVDGNDILVDL